MHAAEVFDDEIFAVEVVVFYRWWLWSCLRNGGGGSRTRDAGAGAAPVNGVGVILDLVILHVALNIKLIVSHLMLDLNLLHPFLEGLHRKWSALRLFTVFLGELRFPTPSSLRLKVSPP